MNINSAKEEEFSSIDPSIVNDFIKSEESDDRRNNDNDNKNYDNDDQDNEEEEQNEEQNEEIELEHDEEEIEEEVGDEERNNLQNMEDGDEFFNDKFSGEVVNIEDDDIEEDYKQNDQINKDSENQKEEQLNNKFANIPPVNKNKRKEKYNPESMERISEVENEDDKHNTIFDKINNELLRDEYKLNEENFDEIMKQNINSKNVKDLFNTALFNAENDKSYKFKPEINKKSHLLANDKRNKSNDSLSGTQRSKTPIELDLYKDAMKRKEKLEKIEYNNMMAIVLNASKTKISNNSHRIAINKIEKIIDSAIQKHEKDKKLSFIGVGEVMTDLKIFREIFSDKNEKVKQNKNYHSYKDIKKEMNNVKEIERRKKSEVDFYEQLWLTLNPDNKEFIRADIFSEFLKILFSPVASSVKEISSILKQFLLAAFFLNTNPDEHKVYVSPITEKNLTDEDIWPLDKVVREFIQLKENILAYQKIHNASKKLIEDLDKEKRERLTFAPELNKDKRDKFQSRSKFWEERLSALLDRDKLRRQVLEEMKKENDESILKECTFKPQINKKALACPDDSRDSANQPVYDKLYSTHKEKQLKRQKEIEEKRNLQASKELDGCTFQPQFYSNKTFEKSLAIQEKPKGFSQTVERMRRGIIETMKKRYLVKKIPVGENYEKIKRANIKPFNITDLKKKEEPEEKEEIKDENNDDYFSIQVTIPSGKERTLRVHKDDDPYEIAENFCRVYGMKDEIKQRLAKTILQFMNLYLLKSNEKSQYNEQLTVSNHAPNNFSQNNLNLDDL